MVYTSQLALSLFLSLNFLSFILVAYASFLLFLATMAVLFEQLHWALLIAGHVLADGDEGEIPAPPDR